MLTEIEQLVEATIALIMAIAALPQFNAWLTLVETIFGGGTTTTGGSVPAPGYVYSPPSAPAQESANAAADLARQNQRGVS